MLNSSNALSDQDSAFRDIYKKALSSLGRREYSAKEMRLLLQKKYPASPEIIEKIIQKLVSDNYLSDERFARSVLQAKSKNYGTNYIKQLLGSHNIDASVVEETIEESKKNELELAKQLLTKKARSKQLTKMQKASFLQKKGFSMDTISKILKEDCHS